MEIKLFEPTILVSGQSTSGAHVSSGLTIPEPSSIYQAISEPFSKIDFCNVLDVCISSINYCPIN